MVVCRVLERSRVAAPVHRIHAVAEYFVGNKGAARGREPRVGPRWRAHVG